MAETVLVTGGGGFLGSAVVRKLLRRGDTVRVLGRNEYPELNRLGAQCFRGDIRDPGTINGAARGCDVIHHIAALPGIWGPRSEFYNINVRGTRNVIEACEDLEINRLVYTSSPSVVHHGGHIRGLKESELDYPSRWPAHYPETKAIAEQEVLAANGKIFTGGGVFRTVSLRPHLIWGPDDPNLIPRIIRRARSGRLRIVGNGLNKVDTIYVENAAQAQILAADTLRDNPVAAAGKSYFITQGEPVVLWEFINRILQAADVPALKRKVPWRMAWLAGVLLEFKHRLLRNESEPMMTRFVAEELSHDHWFDTSAAKQDLGFTPEVSMEEGIRRLVVWIKDTQI